MLGGTMSIVLIIALPLAGIIIGWVVRLIYGKFQLSVAEQRAERLKKDAEKDAEVHKKDLLLAAREKIEKNRAIQEQDLRERQAVIRKIEEKLEQHKSELDKSEALIAQKQQSNEALIAQKQQSNENRERRLEKWEKDLNQDAEKLQVELARIANLSKDEARKQLMSSLEETVQRDAQVLISKIEEDATKQAEKRSRSILLSVMQRIASEISAESTVSTVHLPSEQMKGRIIGKEGRNIKSLETLTGVDFIIDEGSEAVVLSCFDPVRRAVAHDVLEYLVSDGRIHPTKIEEIVEKIKKKINEQAYENGERTLFDLGIRDVHGDMIDVLGKLIYRSSYGQNLLTHSKEVAILSGMIAAEIGCNREIAMRGAIFHDIGKGIVTEQENSHVELGVELAKRCGESEETINAIAAHHGDVPSLFPESVVVQVADALSAARPGARKEALENYFKRLENLENVANEFDGIEKAFAIQAGREIRVIVNNEQVSDDKAKELARSIAHAIEKKIRYPGRIRVTMIRETRIIDYAR